MKTKTQSVAPAAAVVVSAATALITYAILIILHPRWLTAFADWAARQLFRFLAVMALVGWLSPELPAQEAPSEKLPGYVYTSSDSLAVSMPEYPGKDRSPIIAGAVCVGVGVGIIGYVAVKIICAMLNNHEMIVTNNAACGNCPLESPPPPTSPVPNPETGPQTVQVCMACSQAAEQAAAGQPLPLRIEHSYDEQHWETVATGVGVGSEFQLPDVGYWRAVPLFLSISSVEGATTVHAPPGVLEFSSDLREWSVVGIHTAENTDVPAQAGFYRVRLN